MSKNQYTGTATQPQCNRKFCQFNTDQYCNEVRAVFCKMSKAFDRVRHEGLLYKLSILGLVLGARYNNGILPIYRSTTTCC